jgi:MFS superfamily sulfate permease-like transporter
LVETGQAVRTEPAPRNRFDCMEWAGAFGDLGTLIPFVVAYLGVLKMDTFGVLFAFGVAMLVCGVYYRTPMPVQPMKAIGAVAATQAAQSIVITPAAVYAGGVVTGVLWLVLGLTGAAHRVARIVPRPVVVGIVLGLGMGFMLEGIRMMAGGWLVAAIALVGTLLLLTNRQIPAMFVLLAFGAAVGAIQDPTGVQALAAAPVEFHAPSFALSQLTWQDLFVGAIFLALPQLPLTLGNAIIAIREENNRLFPDRPVTEKKLAVSTGVMNLAGAAAGGVPMCHGAGGMAGHVAFGARTGGALVILGVCLLVLAFFFSAAVVALFSLFPRPILGVILFITGAQLALGSCDFSKNKGERFATLATAALAMWNVGLAFVAGFLLCAALRRGLLRL